jgi:hypothetical protein
VAVHYDENLITTGFPHHFFEKAELMAANLSRGKLSAATRAILDPDTLSPDEHRLMTIFKQSPGVGSSIFRAMMETALNPVTLLGVALAIRFPIASAPELFKVMEKSVGSSKHLDPVTGFLSTPRTIFADAPLVAEAIEGVSAKSVEYKYAHGLEFFKSNGLFKQLMGRDMTRKESTLVSLRLDGAHDPKTTHYGRLLADMAKKETAKIKGVALMRPWEETIPDPKLRQALMKVYENDRSVLDRLFKQLEGATDKDKEAVAIGERSGECGDPLLPPPLHQLQGSLCRDRDHQGSV